MRAALINVVTENPEVLCPKYTAFPPHRPQFQQYSQSYHGFVYRVIRNDCRGFSNLPPRSPDATPCDFFLWGYVKDQVYVPPLPANIPELKVRIRTAIGTITADMLQTVWNELDYRVDVCRITKGAHIDTCKLCNKNLECCSIK